MTEERNFCPRCGKRKGGDANYIHTCTPPQPKREWVGLTDAEVDEIYEQAETLVDDSWVGNGTVGLMFPITLYKAIEGKLKEKNT